MAGLLGARELGSFNRLFGALAYHRYYRNLWLTSQAGTLMMWMQIVANGYLAYTLTGSAGALGAVGLAQSLPQVAFSPFGGVLADRFDKRNVMLSGQFLLSSTSVVIGVLIFLGQIQYWHLFAVAVLQGIGFALYIPGSQAWLPRIVSREHLPNAIALNNVGINTSRILGPSLAGLLISIPWFGVNGIYLLRIVSFSWILWLLFQIPISGKPDPGQPRRRLVGELAYGFRYILDRGALTSLFTFAIVITVLGQAYQQVMPAFALGIFGVGSEGLGLMLTVVGIGAISGSLTMAWFSRYPNKARLQAWTATALGLALTLFGLCALFRFFPLALAALFVVGMALDFNATTNNTLIMLNTEQALYGRVMSVYQMTNALAPAGAFMAGVAIDHAGGAATFMGIGVLIVVFVLGMVNLHPGYQRIRETVT